MNDRKNEICLREATVNILMLALTTVEGVSSLFNVIDFRTQASVGSLALFSYHNRIDGNQWQSRDNAHIPSCICSFLSLSYFALCFLTLN